MAEQKQNINLPDLLGVVTDGERINIDVVQAALGLRPAASPAGRTFEALLMLQNAADVDVDVSVQVRLPERDADNKRNRFFAQKSRILVGLRPAEVGYLLLPLSSSPKTVPGQYRLALELGVKRVDKQRPNRVRSAEGGGLVVDGDLPEKVPEALWSLQQTVFSVERAGRNGVGIDFTIQPATLGDVADFAPAWRSLWTLSDHIDGRVLLERVKDELADLAPALTRKEMFFPLLEAVQTRFKAAGFTLRPGEAVFVAKALTLLLEQTAPAPENLERLVEDMPGWLTHACRALFERPQLARSPKFLITDVVFADLVRDTAHFGLEMVSTVVNEDFGSEAEQTAYVDGLVQRLEGRDLDFTSVYLPLVLAGLIANTRIVMPQEKPRDTIWLLHKDREARLPEQDDASAPIFAMTETLIDRALDQTG